MLSCCGLALLDAGETGKITGFVKDKRTGEPLLGVNIILEGTRLGASTAMDGRYTILNVRPGRYTLVASMIGYATTRVTDVRVNIDLTTTVNIELSEVVVELGEEIVVVAERPIVRKDLTSSEARVDADQIRAMPVQEVHQVLSLQAGVTVDRGGGLHLRGGRSNEIAYWVDGVSLTDVYDNSLSVSIENNAIQELQVVSGTFNAEYGQAMSGVINIVTKEGGQQFHGGLTAWSGDYLTFDDDLFPHIGSVSPVANWNLEGSLSGPVPGLGERTSFYVSGRRYYTDGWLYGVRRFTPRGDSGDGSAVPMNWRSKASWQGKFTFWPASDMRLTLSTLGSRENFRDYNHSFRLNPDGDVNKFERGETISSVFTHTLSSVSFYTLNLTRFFSKYFEYLYEDPYDSRYLHPDSLSVPGYSFLGGGTNLGRFERSTTSFIAKFDFTSQIDPVHQIKFGLEGRSHKLFLDGAVIVPATDSLGQQIVPFRPAILDISTPVHDQYTREPVEFSAYVQDKIEYENIIVNVGVRFDYFHSRGEVLSDPSDPNVYIPFKSVNQAKSLEERLQYWYTKVGPKYSLSPRFGIAYPITDQGVLHFSYGHFFQIPSFLFLYNRPGFKVTTAGGVQGVFGNADLEPQRTVMYEVGLQQQLGEQIGFNITGFYRDVRNWISTSPPIPTAIAGVSYVRYINKDYANVRGLTFSLERRHADNFSFSLAYTYQVAEGNNSNPEDEFFAALANAEPTKQLTPLDWDQRHTLNASVSVGTDRWGIGLIGRYGSGLPYSPAITTATRQGLNLSSELIKNSRRRPATMTVDLRAHYAVAFAGAQSTLFLRVFNLFDRRNELDVFNDTGRATYTLLTRNIADTPDRHNTVAEFFTRPDFYSPPREVQMGMSVSF